MQNLVENRFTQFTEGTETAFLWHITHPLH